MNASPPSLTGGMEGTGLGVWVQNATPPHPAWSIGVVIPPTPWPLADEPCPPFWFSTCIIPCWPALASNEVGREDLSLSRSSSSSEVVNFRHRWGRRGVYGLAGLTYRGLTGVAADAAGMVPAAGAPTAVVVAEGLAGTAAGALTAGAVVAAVVAAGLTAGAVTTAGAALAAAGAEAAGDPAGFAPRALLPAAPAALADAAVGVVEAEATTCDSLWTSVLLLALDPQSPRALPWSLPDMESWRINLGPVVAVDDPGFEAWELEAVEP